MASTGGAAGAAAAQQVARRAAGPPTLSNKMRLKFNDVSTYVRREWNKGAASQYYFWGTVVLVIATVYRVTTRFVIPWQEERQSKGVGVFTLKVPMSKEHNEKYGTNTKTPLREAMLEKPYHRVQATQPAEILSVDEKTFQRPRWEEPQQSETAKNPTNHMTLTLREFDEEKQHDVFIRSLYAIGKPDPSSKPTDKEVRKRLSSPTDLAAFGEGIIRGQVKCKAISPTSTCIPTPDVMLETTRKLLLAVGPLHHLRHPGKDVLPFRLSKSVETSTRHICCVGMGDAGQHVMWLNRVFPHYTLDLVESDGGLVRTCRSYFNFQERDGINLAITDPVSYMRARVAGNKRYDAIFVDSIDEEGNIPVNLCKLETISNIRDSLNDRGVAIMNLPNHDERRMASIIANWRMAFDGRAVVLIHCATQQNTILMTFNDQGDKGLPQIGWINDVEDMKAQVRSAIHYHKRRYNFDILAELNERNFQQLLPGRKYNFKRPGAATATGSAV